MPLSRFRPRRLTALLVVLAVLLVLQQIGLRSGEGWPSAAQVARFRNIAKDHALSEARCRMMIPICADQARALRRTDDAASNRLQEAARRYAEQAAHHAQMRKKYE